MSAPGLVSAASRLLVPALAGLLAAWAAQPLAAALVCPETERELLYLPGAPVEDASESICADGPLLPAGRMVCREGADLLAAGRNRRYRVEKGQVDGVDYEVLYINGAGVVQGAPEVVLASRRYDLDRVWTLACETSGGLGATCSVNRRGLEAGVVPSGDVYLRIDRRVVSAQVDAGALLTPGAGGFTAAEALALLQQMAAGERLVYAYREPDSEFSYESEIPLFGFAAAWEVLAATWERACGE